MKGLKLGLKRDEVRVEAYNPEWSREFLWVKRSVMGNGHLKENRMEHIGSTAIKGMVAKPIIDILVGVDDLEDLDKLLLNDVKDAGFLRLKVHRPKEIVFAKFTDETYEVKTHFIHVVEFQGKLWKDLVFFRDYLNRNETARKQYKQVKMDYLKVATSGINEYTNFKDDFVKTIVKKRLG